MPLYSLFAARALLLALLFVLIYYISMKHDIFKTLRIIFCLLAVACCAVMIFVFAYFDWWWGVMCAVCAVLFTLLMLLFKRLQNDCEAEQEKTQTKDFINSDN